MPGNSAFDSALITTTLQAFEKTLEDNIFNDFPLLKMIKMGKMKKSQGHGRDINLPIMYGKNSTAGSYFGSEILDTSEQDGITAATYPWKYVNCSITITGAEEKMNKGESAIISLLGAKIEQARLSLQDVINDMLYADGTGNTGKDILGLAALIKDTPTTGSVGDISRATYDWWRNKYTTATKTSTAYDNLLAAMRSIYNQASHGARHPDLVISDLDTYEGYESLTLVKQRFAGSDAADASFKNLTYKGANYFYDKACPGDSTAGRVYFINTSNLKWIYHPEENFSITPFVIPGNQNMRVAHVRFMGNFGANNLARNGVITAIT